MQNAKVTRYKAHETLLSLQRDTVVIASVLSDYRLRREDAVP